MTMPLFTIIVGLFVFTSLLCAKITFKIFAYAAEKNTDPLWVSGIISALCFSIMHIPFVYHIIKFAKELANG